MALRLYTLIFILALFLSLIWENLHASLYDDYFPELKKLFFLLCAVVDGLITLLIYFLAKLIFKDPLWIIHPLSFKKVLVVLALSFLTAAIMEKAPVLLDFWSYSKNMPVVPIVEIGLSPLLQISFLPLFTFLLIHQLKKI